jgi:hypothetical protein
LKLFRFDIFRVEHNLNDILNAERTNCDQAQNIEVSITLDLVPLRYPGRPMNSTNKRAKCNNIGSSKTAPKQVASLNMNKKTDC